MNSIDEVLRYLQAALLRANSGPQVMRYKDLLIVLRAPDQLPLVITIEELKP